MVSDSLSDMEFRKISRMLTVLISKNLKCNLTMKNVDFIFKDLFSVYSELIKTK